MHNPQKQTINNGTLFYLCLILLALPKPALPDTVSHYKDQSMQYIEPVMLGIYFLFQYTRIPDIKFDLSSSNLLDLHAPEDEHSRDTLGERAKAMMDKYVPSLDTLIDIDNGYIVIIIVETDESGKPVKMHKINTGINYLALKSSELLKNQTALKSAQKTIRYEQLFELIRKSGMLSLGGNNRLQQLSELNFLPLTSQTGSAFHPILAKVHFENDLAQPSVAQESVQQDGGSTQIPEHNNEATRTQLLRLVSILDENYYTGFITEQISSEEPFQLLLQVLPDRFTDLLNNSFDTFLVLSAEKLRDFLRMAVAVASSNYGISQTAGLAYYFDLLMEVFYEGAFEPIEGKDVTSREYLFERLLDIKQISWQTSREPDPELQAWGDDAELMADIFKAVVAGCGYQYVSSPYTTVENDSASNEESGSALSEEPGPAVEDDPAPNKEPLRYVRNISVPAYRPYHHNNPGPRVHPILSQDQLERFLSTLSNLSSGFYRSEDYLLHIDRDSDDNVYSLHIGAGVVLNFSSSDQLLAYYQKNYRVSIILFPIVYSPEYISLIANSELSETVLMNSEVEALKLFGLSLQELTQPNARKTITKKYYKKAKHCHPDKHGTKEAFQALESAKETLFALVDTIERIRISTD